MPDPAVIRKIMQIAQQRGMDREAILGALSTGLVESNLTNIRGGDADSSGWRQERASLYKDPNNLTNSINRFFNEWKEHDKPGFNPGLTAANVQRPAAQYRGRYSERMDEAKGLLAKYGGGKMPSGGMGQVPSAVGEAPVGGASRPNPFGAISAMNQNQQGPYAEILNRGWGLLSNIWEQKYGGQQAAAQSPKLANVSQGGSGAPVTGGGLSGLREAFYDPVGGWDSGKSIGAIGGHDDHMHFGGGPKTVARIVRDAQKAGLTVREYEPVDHVDPVHTNNSWHYRSGGRGAADASNAPSVVPDERHDGTGRL